jgi:hypothetical protein
MKAEQMTIKVDTHMLLVDEKSNHLIYSNMKTECTANESMYQNHAQIQTNHLGYSTR